MLDNDFIDSINGYYVPMQEPIPYGENWKLFPIKVKDSLKWFGSIDILDQDKEKNLSGNIEYISASYLKYLLLKTQEDATIESKLDFILRLSLNISNDYDILLLTENDKCKIVVCQLSLDKNGELIANADTVKTITENEFNDIRKIILYQNIEGYNDKYIDPEIQEVIDEVQEYKAKRNANGKITMANKIAVVQNATHFTHTQIMNMSLREFEKAFTTQVDKVEYMCLRIAELNPNVKFDKPIHHWATTYDSNPTDEAFVDYGNFTQKMSSVT